jgi:hypothetical protein
MGKVLQATPTAKLFSVVIYMVGMSLLAVRFRIVVITSVGGRHVEVGRSATC